ncbi:MAG: selenocysteine-specific translation elongation factor [Chloroflexi bacterium]|nr:selenocysteine-specific translation elongation factor [Chloroflexota bacterium]
MFVIGTAGHVDHGKSTLTEALTGIDPDRLSQEKERGMTIELGFAWMTLPGGLEVSIVDVPGHERFIKNMLMGVGGIDMALLIVAADEGVMPQTVEHLAILDLLQIKRGVVALTKRELVDDEWIDLVSTDVLELLEGTTLADVNIVPVSAMTGAGIPELLAEIERVLGDLPEKRDLGRPRLPVDRSFTISGFGTVVTGTLIDGRVRSGQEVEILPSGVRARIRGLQTHKEVEDEALPGTRVAVNLSGVSHDVISRGDVIATPGWLQPTDVIDASFRVIDRSPRAVKHNASTTLFTGSAESPATIRLLDADSLAPGESGWVQIKLENPIPIVQGDYFVIRDTVATLGGGVALDLTPRRHKRFDDSVTRRLQYLAEGSGEDAIVSAVESSQPANPSTIAQAVNESVANVTERIEGLVNSGSLVSLTGTPDGPLYTTAGWAKLSGDARDATRSFHAEYPLRVGIPAEELRSRLKLKAALFAQAADRLAEVGDIERAGSLIRSPGYAPEFTPEQTQQIAKYLDYLETDRFSPPTDRPIDQELIAALDDQGRVVRLNQDVVYPKDVYDEIESRIIEHGKQNATIALAAVREMFDTSRKYTLAVLEHMDRRQITRRVGDDRQLR